MIIYAPLISEKTPAFVYSESNINIKVPFQTNSMVSNLEFKSIALQIKDYKTSKVIKNNITTNQWDRDNNQANFIVDKFEYTINNKTYIFPEVGQYYKIQIAYIGNLENIIFSELKWSTASLIRCIDKPIDLYITNYNETEKITSIIENCVKYKGIYKYSEYSEPLYSYCFNLYNQYDKKNPIETSDEQIWNNKNDQIDDSEQIIKSAPEFTIQNELLYNQIYSLDFVIKTINGYTETKSIQITKATGLQPIYDIGIIASVNFEEGYISISFDNTKQVNNINGQFILERNSLKSFEIWEELSTFSIGPLNDISNWSFRDFSVEQGETYTYRIRQFNNSQVSIGINSNSIKADFEDMFLTDGKKQLKIKFDPKISSFKTTTLESKLETLGSKYPYFFRNNQVSYKEIPISGLISYLMDDNQFFITYEDLGLEPAAATTNLVDYNITAERKFRLEVLDWLNNGEPKFFRSPTEGNYILRLMNISASPNDTLGRMLYSFSCTGYEIAPITFKELNNLGLIKFDKITEDIVSILWQGSFSDLGNNNSYAIRDIEKNCWTVNNIKDFKWTTSILEDQNTCYIKLYPGEIVIKNFSGIVETPKDTVYEKIEIYGDMYNSYFEFYQTMSQYIATNDNFGNITLIKKWVNLDNNSTFTFKETDVVYYLSITGNGAENASATINNEIIMLSDSQSRQYHDISISSISLTNATGILYYGRVVEV